MTAAKCPTPFRERVAPAGGGHGDTPRVSLVVSNRSDRAFAANSSAVTSEVTVCERRFSASGSRHDVVHR